MVGAAGVFVVVDHPVHEAVDQDVRAAYREGIGPDWRDLPHVITWTRTVGMTLEEVQLEIVEAGDRQVEARTNQVGLDIAFAELIGHSQQHVLDRAKFDFAVEYLAQRQARGELAVNAVFTVAGISLAAVVGVIDKQKVVSVLPAVGVLKGDGLLYLRVDGVVLAIEIRQAVALPLNQVTGHGMRGEQHAASG